MYREKKSLSTTVYDHLKNKILNNDLLPGDKLIEMEIAKELGVSRTPVREALAKLAEHNLAESFPRKSYIVSKICMKDAKDLYSVRTALEPLAIRLIAEEGIDNRTKELKNIMEKMTTDFENDDIESVKNLAIQWNICIIKLTKNTILSDTLNLINEKLYRFVNFLFREDNNVKEIYKDLKKIFTFIEAKDCDKAYKASNNYVSGLYPMLERQSDYKMFRF